MSVRERVADTVQAIFILVIEKCFYFIEAVNVIVSESVYCYFVWPITGCTCDYLLFVICILVKNVAMLGHRRRQCTMCLRGNIMLFGGFSLSCVLQVFVHVRKWSAKATIPVFPPEGVSLPHTPRNASIGLLCLEHRDITIKNLHFYWLALKHIVRDRLRGGTSLSS